MIEELFFIKILAMSVYILVGVLFTFAFIMMWDIKRDIEEWKKIYFWKGGTNNDELQDAITKLM